MRWIVALALVLCLAGPAIAQNAPGPVGAPEGRWRAQNYWIPMNDNGVQRLLYTQLCRPPGDAPARVMVFAHGTPADKSTLATLKPLECSSEAARWFLDRGFIVVASMRRGYGKTGGPMGDWDGACGTERNYARVGLDTATDIAATVDYAATLPFARQTGMALVGLSAGGWGAIAYDSMPHPRVSAIVNFAGGNGGHYNNRPDNVCFASRLEADAGVLARGAATPMLWIYAANDSFFGPPVAAAMYAAYAQAGGKADFQQVGSFGSDGHHLFGDRGGSAIWGPLVERYLATRPAQ